MSDEQLRYEEEKYQYEESHREMKYPRTNNAYHKSRRDNSDRIDALLAECEKMEDELAAQGKLERELAAVTEQRDRLAYALFMCRRELVDVLDDINKERVSHDGDDFHESLRISKDALAAVKGGSHDN
jgi:hypothetical protein